MRLSTHFLSGIALNLIAADLKRHGVRENLLSPRTAWLLISKSEVRALIFMRIEEDAVRMGHPRFAELIRSRLTRSVGADLVPGFQIGPGFSMPHPVGVVIGRGTRIGQGVTIMQNATLGERNADGKPPHGYPTIHDNVVVGAGACILGSITIGEGARIGANSVVLENVPAGATVAGVPAKIQTKRENAYSGRPNQIEETHSSRK